ncbi:MAG TPA: pilus assembly protein [Candidatus Brocadiia bacterium]|nr:pilus assembly protein [Candidatus Brocadiia bacterium]
MKLHNERGQVVVEYAIVFPIQLLITLAIIQLAEIFVAKQVVSYAAFCGARAQIVGENPADAACLPLAAVAGGAGAESEPDITLPGWGELRGSGAARAKTAVEVYNETIGSQTVIRCDVTHSYELSVPFGNHIASLFVTENNADNAWGAPHIKITGTSSLVKPWSDAGEIGEPASAN